MRIDYRNYRQPVVIWTRARRSSALALVAVLFAPPGQRRARWLGLGPLGVQPSELAKIAVIFFMAALLERRMDRIDERRLLAAADRRGRSAAWSALILAEPDLGTAVCDRDDRRGDGVRRRHQLPLRGRPAPGVACRPSTSLMATSDYRWQRVTAFLDPWARSARRRLPDDPVDDRRRHRRHLRPRPDGRACRSCSTCPSRTTTSSTR